MRMKWKSGFIFMTILLIRSSVIVNASENVETQVSENIGAIAQESYLDSERNAAMQEDIIYQEGWNGTVEANDRCYIDSEGNKLIGLNWIEGKWYYFDENGYLKTGWQTVEEKIYYFSLETGERYENGVYVIEDEEYSFDENGEVISKIDSEDSVENGLTDTGDSITDDTQDNSQTNQSEQDSVPSETEDVLTVYQGWQRASEGWYYYDSFGNKVTGWLRLGNNWYYLDGINTEHPGLMVTGPKKEINGYTYFFEGGGVMQTGWISQPEGKYYAYAGGNQAYGWQQIGNKWYYFDRSNQEYPGLMVVGCSKVIGGKTYYFDENGAMQTGWVRQPEGWYYTDANGNRMTGWLQLGSNWYYLDGNNTEYPGLMVTGPKKEINGYTYFFEGGGVMQTGWVRQPEGWYYAYPGGNQRIGWLQLGSNWYYLDGNNTKYPGLMVTGPKEEINGYTYFFEGGGVMQTGWVKFPEGWYYAYPGGNQKYGWLQLSSGRYYLDGSNEEYPGLMASSCTMQIDGQEYTFRSDGRAFTGWKYVKGEGYYYYDNTGLLASGWRLVNDRWYYMDPQNNNIMVSQQWKRINGYWYYFRADGDMATGWIYIGGNYYYLSTDGVMRTGWQWIGEDRYYFYKENDPNGGGWGVMAKDTTIDGITIDSSGRADKAYSYAIEILDQVGWNLHSAFNWCVGLRYIHMIEDPAQGSEWFAKYGFENRKGNCYVMAATFYYMAKVLGYDAHQIAGYVMSVNGNSPHSWVEINIEGTLYVFDVSFENGGLGDGYYFTYGTPGTWRYVDYFRMN